MRLFVCSVKKTEIDTLLKEKVNILQLNILLRGGKFIWDDIDETNYSKKYIINEYLKPNDLPFIDIWQNEDYKDEIYVLIDDSKTKFDDFYKENEIAKDDNYTLCWKKIYLFLNNNSDDFIGTNVSYFNDSIINKMLSNFVKYVFNKYIKST